jgi:hypothetical protein
VGAVAGFESLSPAGSGFLRLRQEGREAPGASGAGLEVGESDAGFEVGDLQRVELSVESGFAVESRGDTGILKSGIFV